MRIDHVIVGARRIEPVRDWLGESHGFGMIRGSTHEDGTQGWLVPFDTPLVQYLEILTVGDPERLSATDFGRCFLDRTAAGPAFLNWAVLSDDIDRDATRLRELTGGDPALVHGRSVRADGAEFPWAEAGFAMSWQHPWRPFFLQYGNPEARAARVPGDLAAAAHATTPRTYTGVRVRAEPGSLSSWLGPHDLPVSAVAGTGRGVESVGIATGTGDVELTLP